MNQKDFPNTELTGVQRRHMMIRAVAASAVGTMIEWYDFFLYGIAAALVFPRVFFPASDPFTGTLLSFSTFFVGFVARPFGAAIFGHYGDRIGRKSALVATLILMGVATIGIGLVPSYETLGVWAPVLLIVGRILQGIGVGGEWGGSVLMAGEWTDPNRRGFTTSWAQFGAPAGLVLANGALAFVSAVTSETQFLAWGWRVPFLASVLLIAVGLYIRLGILETPVFARLRADGRLEKAPLVEVLRRNWREVVLTALLRSGQQAPFYIFTTYILSYGTTTLGLARGTVLNLVMLTALLSLITIPTFGHLSDRVGRRRLTAIGCVAMMVFPFVYFAMLDSGVMFWIVAAILVSEPIHDLQYGPQAAFIAESFPGSLRYSGASLGYQLASITAGGPAPIVALYLFETYKTSLAIAVYLSASALVSLLCVWVLRDRAGALDHH
ncbi:MAG: MFS transporter [Acidobacteriota bacterium]